GKNAPGVQPVTGREVAGAWRDERKGMDGRRLKPARRLRIWTARGRRGQAPRQPGQVRKEAAVTSPAWVASSLSPTPRFRSGPRRARARRQGLINFYPRFEINHLRGFSRVGACGRTAARGL